MPPATSNKPRGTRRTNKEKSVLEGISKPAIKRLARLAGVNQMSSTVCNDVRESLNEFVERVIKSSMMYSDHAGRKTLTHADLLCALNSIGVRSGK